jgi:hypothetical protein
MPDDAFEVAAQTLPGFGEKSEAALDVARKRCIPAKRCASGIAQLRLGG